MDDGPGPEDLPEAAAGRLGADAFSSGLSVPDFAAAVELGLEPVGLVQGFCVMQWGYLGFGPMGAGAMSGWGLPQTGATGRSGYAQTYQCPHGFVGGDHRTWGQNVEDRRLADAWDKGFGAAFDRLLAEAVEAGAHGVIGVTDRVTARSELGVTEFHLLGTAVRVPGAPVPTRPWSTYLAGQRLLKLLEAGYMPVAVTTAMAVVRVWAYCMTQYLMEGAAWTWGGMGPRVQEVDQVTDAQMAVRRLVRERVRGHLGVDSLHGATLETASRHLGEADEVLEAVLRGTRVRRVRAAAPLPPPLPTVRLT